MKLLIVDDEELTRSGVIASLDWKSLGIEEILQAGDGLDGLEKARIHRPEIILCDVRMPHMDGITMLKQLESLLPDTAVIFMSGYSDKEYLKAAIKLKAVNYIEKPLNLEELKEAVTEAVRLHQRRRRDHRGETLCSLEANTQLALLLCAPYESNQSQIRQLLDEGALSQGLSPSGCFTTMIVHMDQAPELTGQKLEEIYRALEEFLRRSQMGCLYASRRSDYYIYDLIGAKPPSEQFLRLTADFLGHQFEPFGNYFIAAGEPCMGISKCYQSYASAVVLLQSAYFFAPGTFLTAAFLSGQVAAAPPAHLPAAPETVFGEYLQAKNEEQAHAFLQRLMEFFDGNYSILPNQARDLYYKLFVTLENSRRQQQLTQAPDSSAALSVLETAFTYRALHQELVNRTAQYFADLKASLPQHSTIFLIKDYISRNYSNELLSVKDIGDHVYLSASYVCTFFKNETGQTLNQYLTQFRMEKAKQLLADSRYRIADISSKVGYSDGNYFGKSFKKYTGISPSEFRERMQ